MKKLLSLSIASLALAAAADPYFSPEIGVQQFTATTDNFILPVKFDSLGQGAISAKELVATNGLDVNTTTLYVFSNNTYTAWILSAAGWAPLNNASDVLGASEAPLTQTLAAGTAIWITPANGKTFSIYGKVRNFFTVALEVGTSDAPKNNLLCNPTSSPVSLEAKLGSITPAKGDTIRLVGAVDSYTYGGSAWYKIAPGTVPAVVSEWPSIAAYQGFWYMSKGGSGSIAW